VTEGRVARDGFGLQYRSSGEGAPVLTLSGGPGIDADYLEPVAEEMARSHRTILVELRGTGRSIPPRIDRSTVNLKLYLEDLEALRAALGIERWTVLGHSAGANLAMHYALAFPARTAALVLADSGPVRESVARAIWDNLLPRLTAEERAGLGPAPNLRTLLPAYFFDRDKGRDMIETFRGESFHPEVAQLLAADEMAPGMDMRPALAGLETPALIVAGRQDPIDPAMQYEIHLALRGSRLVLLERCGHYPWLEQPDAFFAAVREFLAAVG